MEPGVLVAAQKVLANAQANPNTDPDVVKARTLSRTHDHVVSLSSLASHSPRARRFVCRRAHAQSVASVVELLQATLEALQRLAPKAKLAESLTQLDPSIPEERATMQELMQLAFAENGLVDRVDFVEDMVYFLQARPYLIPLHA